MDEEIIPSGNPAQGEVAETPTSNAPEAVTPELAESLPLPELKARLRAEAEAATSATPDSETPGGEEGDGESEGDAPEEDTRPARDGSGRFTKAGAQDQGTRTTEREYRQPETLEDAIRVLGSVRGNLETAVSQRQTLENRIRELEAEATRQKQQATQAQMQAQHQQIVEAIQRLPSQQARDAAYAEYQAGLGRAALGDFQTHLSQQEQTLQQREFNINKRELPAMYEDIATFVAEQHEIPADRLLEYVRSDRVKGLLSAAQNQEAVAAITIVLGETLDDMATREAGSLAAAKAQRREKKAATSVRDAPPGLTPGSANVDEVARINNMSKDEFAAFKKKLADAHYKNA